MATKPVNELRISAYLEQVLERWSIKQPYFTEVYRALPFGSRIILDNLDADIDKVRVRFFPNTRLMEQLATLQELQKLSAEPWNDLPESIDIGAFRLDSQINSNVYIVRIPDIHQTQQFIFKTNTRDPKYLYHELKILLSNAEHPHMISRPLYIVTVQGHSSSPPTKIVGFVMELHPLGSLRDRLDLQPKPSLPRRYRWAIQLTQTLQDITGRPMGFYSDLKPDNVLLSADQRDVLLIDFEQAGNWDDFSAPEIFYVNWARKLARLENVPPSERQLYATQLCTILGDHSPASPTADLGGPSLPPAMGSSSADDFHGIWTALPPRRQEAAMVYSLGKMLWCIFESCSHPRSSTDAMREHRRPVIEFPAFRHTPEPVRALIRDCTRGAPEWAADLGPDEKIRIVLDQGRFLPRSEEGNASVPCDGDGAAAARCSPVEAVQAAKRLWSARVRRMQKYLDFYVRWIEARGHDADIGAFLGFPHRPRLCDVLAVLERVVVVEDTEA